MSTTRIFLEIESSEHRQCVANEGIWQVFLIRYARKWRPRRWRDVPPADAVTANEAIVMHGVSRSIAECYLKTFNGLELKRPKRHWACAAPLAS